MLSPRQRRKRNKDLAGLGLFALSAALLVLMFIIAGG